eukprot:gene6028-9133_t
MVHRVNMPDLKTSRPLFERSNKVREHKPWSEHSSPTTKSGKRPKFVLSRRRTSREHTGNVLH